MTNHVFISYAREDRENVDRIARYLECNGVRVWYDKKLQSGDDFRDEIADAIDDACAFVAIFSRHTANRIIWGGMPEIDRAIARQRQLMPGHRFIFPVVLGFSQIPSIRINETQTFRSLQVTRLAGMPEQYRSAANQLAKSLRSVAGVATPVGQTEISPLRGVTGGIAAVLKGRCADVIAACTGEHVARRLVWTIVLIVTCIILRQMWTDFVTQEPQRESAQTFARNLPLLFAVAGLPLIWLRQKHPILGKSTSPPSFSPTNTTSVEIKALRKSIMDYQQNEIRLRRELRQSAAEFKSFSWLIPNLAIWAAIWYSFCAWIAYYPLRTWVRQVDYQAVQEPFHGMFVFSGAIGSGALYCIVSFVLCLRAHRYGVVSKRRAAFMILVGGFVAGFAWALQLTPQMCLVLQDSRNYQEEAGQYFRTWKLSMLDFF